ncbi:hypothetical protein BZG36_02937 [Bifiguratus adelaidae]|uniref:Uncharacterized protein n=1 Tax=Bifiguratus adelaidae TaxID=1938954 RepID=A0A261Y023_9FUNG|nr:hypothetical protein BZG36_02937 [Bifiguratus adelaidae]
MHLIVRYDLHNNITLDGPQDLLNDLYEEFKQKENRHGVHHVEKAPEYLWPPRTLLIRLTHSPRMGEFTLAPVLDILEARGYKLVTMSSHQERETYVLSSSTGSVRPSSLSTMAPQTSTTPSGTVSMQWDEVIGAPV